MIRFNLCFAALTFFLCGTSVVAQEIGEAVYYSSQYVGTKTASGEPFDPNAMTAAHRTLPYGAIVRVTSLSNGRSVDVRINDMGPSKPSRIIELTPAAAKLIGLDIAGVMQVRLDVLQEYPANPAAGMAAGANTRVAAPASQAPASVKPPAATQPAAVAQPAMQTALPGIRPAAAPAAANPAATQTRALSAPAALPAAAAQRSAEPAAASPASPAADPLGNRGLGLFQLSSHRIGLDGAGLQLGAYSSYRSMLEAADMFYAKGLKDVVLHVQLSDGKEVFRLLAGPFKDMASAKTFQAQLKGVGIECWPVALSDLK